MHPAQPSFLHFLTNGGGNYQNINIYLQKRRKHITIYHYAIIQSNSKTEQANQRPAHRARNAGGCCNKGNNIIIAKINGNYETDNKLSIKEDKEHTWEVAVEFYPLGKYQRKKWWKFW